MHNRFIYFISSSNIVFGQNFNKDYTRIDVFNNQGQNIHDFVFSYDVINGNHTCLNNFTVISNVKELVNFNFKIYYNNNLVYFDNAFTHCNVLGSQIRIVVN
ncbi:MAG: hypothetical protein V3V28_09750 [Polaribacter sp.]|uniref:hypothetical protein n=1 Tax=Polaribacter sp. TaxID=1920175 RepID=UPI002F35FEAD